MTKKSNGDLEQGHDVGGTARRLRWTRIVKSVEIVEASAGLLSGSISSPSKAAFVPPPLPPSTLDVSEHKLSHIVEAGRKVILGEVSGSASPGEVMALMGPSGSGKTSLLDVLSGRSSYDSGSLILDEELVTSRVMKKLKKKIAYVKQSDIFFGHLTVRDQLTYTALLRLPSTWPKARKIQEVDGTIRRLRLTSCADTPIFMISGGEKKRVNIGSELLTDPAIILLDEPTSGLDSTSAVALMKILTKLAVVQRKTIITSIHQPSSAIFFGFHRLMLLADGNVVYLGTPKGSLDHVANLGLDCPSGYNAADHMMDMLVIDTAIDNDLDDDYSFDDDDEGGDETLQRTMLLTSSNNVSGASTTKQRMIEGWDGEAVAKKIDEDFGLLGGGEQSDKSHARSIVETQTSFNTTWWTQYKVLVHRSMKNSRSAIFTTLNLIKAGAIGLMVGLLWYQMPYTEATVFDRSSYYFFTMTFWVFDAMFTAYMTFPLERSIIFKERASGSYHLSAYFMAKTTSEAPARLALPAIYMIISYWLSGVNDNFMIFLSSTLCSLLSVMAGESIGLFLGAAILDLEKGTVIMTVVALGLMVIGGFFIRNVPSFIMWLGYISPFKYSYSSSVQLVFDRPVPCDGSGLLSVCNNTSVGTASVDEVLDYLGVQGSTSFNASMLLVVFFVVRVMAFFALKSKKANERVE